MSNVVRISQLSAVSQFDYKSVSPPVASFLKSQADRIREYTGRAIIQIGKDLAAAKRYLSHGHFLRWVETEIGIPPRTAQAYMRAAQWAADKGATIAHLTPTALYMLSAPSAPAKAVSNIWQRMESGEHFTPKRVREELKAARLTGRGPHHSGSRSAQQGDVRVSRDTFGVTGAAQEFVSILSAYLPARDFARVRKIMTDDHVIDSPKFPRAIKTAFEKITDVIAPGTNTKDGVEVFLRPSH